MLADHFAPLPFTNNRVIDDDFPNEEIAGRLVCLVSACTLMVQPTILDMGLVFY